MRPREIKRVVERHTANQTQNPSLMIPESPDATLQTLLSWKGNQKSLQAAPRQQLWGRTGSRQCQTKGQRVLPPTFAGFPLGLLILHRGKRSPKSKNLKLKEPYFQTTSFSPQGMNLSPFPAVMTQATPAPLFPKSVSLSDL